MNILEKETMVDYYINGQKRVLIYTKNQETAKLMEFKILININNLQLN